MADINESNFPWLDKLKVGDCVYLENMPFSQKYYFDDDLKDWAYMKAKGKILNISIDTILLKNEFQEEVIFKPIPPLSGDIYIQKL